MLKRKVNLLQGPILKNLILLAAPLMATAFVQVTYNIVDMMWVGRLGTSEVAAVGTSSIYTWIAFSVGAIAKVGSNVYASQYYGAKDHKMLNNTIKNGLLLVLILALLYFIGVQVFAKNLVGFYNLEKNVNDMGVTYLRLISFGYFVQFLNPVLSSLYNSIGDSIRPFKMNSLGLIINLVLDPVLIFGFGPIPAMGIIGAGVATIFAQFVVSVLFFIDIYRTKNELYQGLVKGVVHNEELVRIFKLGFPAGIQSVFMASISLVLNRFLSMYGSTPLAVHTIGTNIESISWVSVEGFQAGTIAFVGQNYGANMIPRLKETIRKAMTVVGIIGIVTSFLLIFFRNDLFNIFLDGDKKALTQGSYFLLILGLSQFFMAIEIGASGVFHGLGKTSLPSKISIIFNLMRIPIALLLMPYFDFYGVWMAVTISSIFKGSISNIALYKTYRKL